MGKIQLLGRRRDKGGNKKKEKEDDKRKKAVQGETYWGFSHQVSSFQIH
jgi:hypothetical protein